MATPALTSARLVAQRLVGSPFPDPTSAVSAFGAMQGQDLPGVVASAALRSSGAVADVLTALDDGRLVRGYPMRGTVFLMDAADVVWATQLCAEPSLRAAANRRHQLGLDAQQIERAGGIAEEALDSGPMSRADLFAVWEAAGLAPAGGRGYHMLFTLIAATRLVYGPWNGADQDVALVRQWLPGAAGLAERFDGDRTAAVAEWLLRYLTSHGPATVRDFAWWTKLTLGEIRRALPLIVDRLETDGAAEPSYWRPGLHDEVRAVGRTAAQPLLLPGFDEYVLGYADRLFAMADDHHRRLVPGNNGVFKRSVVIGGRVVGTWTRAGRPGRRTLEIDGFVPISEAARSRLEARYGEFPFAAD